VILTYQQRRPENEKHNCDCDDKDHHVSVYESRDSFSIKKNTTCNGIPAHTAHCQNIHFTWCFPKPLCQFVSFIFVDAHLSSAMLICAMSIDRYLNLTRPHWFQSRHEGRKSCEKFVKRFPLMISPIYPK
jgi:hypothetical protein